MRRVALALVGVVLGIGAVVGVVQSLGRPRSGRRGSRPIPPTSPPGRSSSRVPTSSQPVPDLGVEPVGEALRPGPRSEMIAVTVLVVLVLVVAAGLFVLLEQRGS